MHQARARRGTRAARRHREHLGGGGGDAQGRVAPRNDADGDRIDLERREVVPSEDWLLWREQIVVGARAYVDGLGIEHAHAARFDHADRHARRGEALG